MTTKTVLRDNSPSCSKREYPLGGGRYCYARQKFGVNITPPIFIFYVSPQPLLFTYIFFKSFSHVLSSRERTKAPVTGFRPFEIDNTAFLASRAVQTAPALRTTNCWRYCRFVEQIHESQATSLGWLWRCGALLWGAKAPVVANIARPQWCHQILSFCFWVVRNSFS